LEPRRNEEHERRLTSRRLKKLRGLRIFAVNLFGCGWKPCYGFIRPFASFALKNITYNLTTTCDVTMKNDQIKPLDVVALTEDLPERELWRGQVGTVVEKLAPDVFEVEFSDNEGRTFASLALKTQQLLVLHYEPAFA
jgi:hypothetical protein